MNVVSLDCETWLIEPGMLAPPLVCVQWQYSVDNLRSPADMLHRDHAKPIIEGFLRSSDLLVGHNLSFDMAVIGAQWPDLLPLIFAKYDRDEVTDTLLRDQLIMISKGLLKFAPSGEPGEFVKMKYSLADCVARHCGRSLRKEGWRMFYRVFDEHPDVATWDPVAKKFQDDLLVGRAPAWVQDYLDRGILNEKHLLEVKQAPPWEAREYALGDPTAALDVYEAQERMRWR